MIDTTEKDRILGQDFENEEKEAKWSYLRQIMFTITISSGMLMMGFFSGSTSMLPKVLNENPKNNYTSEDLQYLASMPLLMQIPINIFSFYLTEKFGPTCILRCCLVVGFFSYILIIFLQTLATLWAFRTIIAGLSFGVLGNIMVALIAEISEPEIRGFCGAIPGITLSFGILFPYIAFTFLNGALASACNVVPVCLAMVGSIFLPESPYWLYKNGKQTEAVISIVRIIGRTRKNKQEALFEETASLYENNTRLSEEGETKSSIIYQISLLKKSKNWKPLVLVNLIFFFRECGGISTIFYYMLLIFQESDVNVDAFTCTIIAGVIRLISTIATSFLQDKLGRRFVILFTTFLSGFCLLASCLISYLEIEELELVSLISIMIYIFAVNMGLGSISFLLFGELIPMEIKFLGNGIVNTFTTLFRVLVICTAPSLIRIIGINFLFMSFCIVNFSAFITLYFTLPETKQKTLTQLENLFY